MPAGTDRPPTEFGGQGLPDTLAIAVKEMVCSANLSFSLGPLLTTGAVEALLTCASDELKAIFLEKMVTGEWTGTMNLTEPQAGSDLAQIRSRAEPHADGSYRVFGQKIFITYGDHDMTDNIVHLVLASLPDAPAGVKGIRCSVPKYLVNPMAASAPARRHCVSMNTARHPPARLRHGYGDNGGAVGYLLGEANRGLEYMFIMMNEARLGVGLQGIALGERAYQQALSYARERKQGRDAITGETLVTLDKHPDIRRMLMLMKCRVEACRAVTYYTSGLLDRAHRLPDAEAREKALYLAEFMIPIVKGGGTEMGIDVTSLGIQNLWRHGLHRGNRAAQHWRDSRITTIYEGTTGIQAKTSVSASDARPGAPPPKLFRRSPCHGQAPARLRSPGNCKLSACASAQPATGPAPPNGWPPMPDRPLRRVTAPCPTCISPSLFAADGSWARPRWPPPAAWKKAEGQPLPRQDRHRPFLRRPAVAAGRAFAENGQGRRAALAAVGGEVFRGG